MTERQKKEMLEAIAFFREDLEMELQTCTPQEVWDMVDGLGLLGFKDYLVKGNYNQELYTIVCTAIRHGVRTIGELVDLVNEEEADDCRSAL